MEEDLGRRGGNRRRGGTRRKCRVTMWRGGTRVGSYQLGKEEELGEELLGERRK